MRYALFEIFTMCGDLPVVKISPEWVMGPEHGKSSGRIATFSPIWQKESWQTFEETPGYVRLERVNKWPNSI